VEAVEKLKADLGRLRQGRFDVKGLERVRVMVHGAKGGQGKGNGGKGKGGEGKGEGKESVRLGDLAQVMPRGRNVVVMVGEADVCFLFIFLSPLPSSYPAVPYPTLQSPPPLNHPKPKKRKPC